ncbi:MAG: cytidylate kinase-like family protein [Clostridiales bacterium]|nr:cytidylate kinase-like family protein [Clostridiales bacterium]
MENNIIVTIGRQYGSGGRIIGKKLSEKLDLKFYDKEILTLAAKESGIHFGLFEEADEKRTNHFWSTLAMGTANYIRPHAYNDIPMDDRLFFIQSDIIKKVAKKESCVIVGRCADRILKDHPRIVKIFIHSSFEDKIKRIADRFNIPESEAKELMIKKDKERANYYNYYSEGGWGEVDNYHLSIDSSILGIDGTVELLSTFVITKFNLSI